MSKSHRSSLRKWLLLLSAIACAVTLAACTPSPVTEATTTPESPPAGALLPAEITFVDYSGFLITCGGKKILVDGHTSMAPREVRELLEQAQPPFDDVDLILTTHIHSDHFSARLVGAHLQRSPNTAFVSTQKAVEDLKAAFPGLEEERLRPFEPREGERLKATVNGIDLEMLNLPHGVPITNLGFVVHLGGRKLVHTGDLVDVAALEAYGLSADSIDIAFVPYFFLIDEEFLTEDGHSPILEAIQAERIVPMHLSTREYSRASILEDLAASYPESILFHEALETQVVK
jgi:L-ascorbate metabolism protein UlaG (beta-lactamase superfamily)